MDRLIKRGSLLWVLACAPLGMGAKGCTPLTSTTPAPDVNGEWDVSYDDTLDVEVRIGGATYQAEVPAGGGTVAIEYEGTRIEFDLDCARTEVICPSEAWPAQVSAEQREAEYPHRMWVTLPRQSCVGTMRQPAEEECGEGTWNPDCDAICDGVVSVEARDTFGLISEEGDDFDLLLGGGIATNGVNCALLGVSSAHADIVSSGEAESTAWRAESFANGRVVTAYAGGCLWVGDPDHDEALEALVVGASVTLRTGFTATRTPER